MTEPAPDPALFRLMAWLSPSFPTGAFAFSHGLEAAVHDGLVASRDDLCAWLADLVTVGSAWNDAVLFAEARRRAETGGDLAALAELAEALAGSAERHLETTVQGKAFLAAAAAWPSPGAAAIPYDAPLPVAAGATAGLHGIEPGAALVAFLHAFVGNLVQAALRLMPLGQLDGVKVVAALEPTVLATARRAAASSLDDLGTSTVMAEITALRHETLASRIFRS